MSYLLSILQSASILIELMEYLIFLLLGRGQLTILCQDTFAMLAQASHGGHERVDTLQRNASEYGFYQWKATQEGIDRAKVQVLDW